MIPTITYHLDYRITLFVLILVVICISVSVTAFIIILRRASRTFMKLKENEQRLSMAIEYGNFGVMDRDVRKNSVIWNERMYEIYGLTRDSGDMNYEAWHSFIHPEDKYMFSLIPECYETDNSVITREFRIIRPDGETRHIRIDGNVIRDEKSAPVRVVSLHSDITDLKKTETALRESEERFRSIVSSIREWIWSIDLEGKPYFNNPAVTDMLGYTPEELSLKQIPFELVHEDDLVMLRGLIDYSIKNRTGWNNIVFRWIHKDGSVCFLESSSVPVFDDAGNIRGFQGVHRDVTERHAGQEALKKSEKRYRAIFESTVAANLISDDDGLILMVNRGFAEITGFSKFETEGKMNITDFLHKDDIEKIKYNYRMRRIDPSAVPSSYEFRLMNRAGDIVNVFMSAALIPGTTERIISMIDISNWKRSEQARSESEERFREMSALLSETIYETDTKGVFTYVNNAGFEKTGYVPADVKNGVSVFDVISREGYTRMVETKKRLMNGEKSVVDEYTILKKDGATFPVLVQATAIYRGGRFEGHRGFVIDISEKKNLESQLSRSQKMEAIGTLAGGIAHDFNNLLMGILGNISLVLMKLDSNTQAYDRLKSVEEYVQRGSSLTNQLLGFARGGKYEVKLTDMGKFVKDIYRLFGRTRKDIRIFHKTQKGLRAVEVDQGQMERVLMNLFVNASHAMPGGGSLYLSEENIDLDRTQVSPYGLDPGRFISLCIRDTGTGMDEATKSRLFEPFFTTKERGQGTGLGLASAYGIVSNHGGFITVESEIGEGTTFTIYLPASDREIETTVKNTGKTTGGNETILLIDDENMILMLCADMLKELGYKVITAAGGISGIKLYENNIDEIDLVILDMIMPDINGREVYEAIIWMNPDAKILLSSGYSLDSQAKEIMDMGCRGFIQKPFVIADLSAKVREILDKE